MALGLSLSTREVPAGHSVSVLNTIAARVGGSLKAFVRLLFASARLLTIDSMGGLTT